MRVLFDVTEFHYAPKTRPERTITFKGVADAVIRDKIAINPVTGNLFIGGLSERGVKKISIWAIDPRTGEMAQRFLPGPEVAGYGGWFDFNNAIKRQDGAQKVNMFRWHP